MSVGSAREEHRLKITFPDDALNNLREVVVLVNLKGVLVWWNRAASDVTGYSNEELSSMKASTFFSESGASLVDDMIAHASRSRSSPVTASVWRASSSVGRSRVPTRSPRAFC
jgi:PAS domain S-box-containing protein